MVRILAIEDEAHILENIAETLTIEGFEVISANGGREGVELARIHKPDLILCDIMMPEFDGFGVLMALRSEPETANIPFVFLTALVTRSAMRRGMELGADDYLTKPFTPDELLKAVRTRLERHQRQIQETEARMENLRGNIMYALPHELRTPLAGLIGCADFMVMDYENLAGESLLNLAQVMLSAGLRLQRVIENYLLYAQIEILSSDPQRIRDLRQAVMDYPHALVMETAQTHAQTVERPDDLQVDVHPGVIGISHDNLHKIAFELIDNAFKFSSPGTPVMVSARSDHNRHYVIRIQDHGRGMSQQELAQVGAYMQFNRRIFEQQGLGLGLIIAQRLVELHGGSLSIDSIPGEGTVVSAQFPLF